MNNGSRRVIAIVCLLVAWLGSTVSGAGIAGGGAPTPAPQTGPGAVLNPTNKADLAVFADGPWKGKNAVYQAPAYDFTMDGTGRIDLHPKTNGVRAGKAILVAFGCNYYDPKVGNTVGRPIVDFTESPKPKVYTAAGTIKLSGIFDENVQFTVTVTYAEKSFAINCQIKDPPRLKIASNCGYHARIQPTHTPAPEMTIDQIKALMPGHSVQLTPVEGTVTTYGYWQSMKSQGVREIVIRGPWGTQDIRIKTPLVMERKSDKKHAGYFSIYDLMPPYKGFHVGRAVTSGGTGGKLELEFE